MIFDFGRCFWETDKWDFLAYYKTRFTEKEKEEILKTHPDLSERDKMYYTCKQYAKLILRGVDREIHIMFFDEEINTFIKCIRHALKEKLNYIRYSGDFEAINEDVQISVCGGINTYEQN